MERAPDDSKPLVGLFEARIACVRSDLTASAIAWLKDVRQNLMIDIKKAYDDLINAGTDLASQPVWATDPSSPLILRTALAPTNLNPHQLALKVNLERFLGD